MSEPGVRKVKACAQDLLPALRWPRITTLVARHCHTEGLLISSALFPCNLAVEQSPQDEDTPAVLKPRTQRCPGGEPRTFPRPH